MSISSLYNTTVTFSRRVRTTDGLGSSTVTLDTVSTVPCRLRPLDVTRQRVDDQGQFLATHRLWIDPLATLQDDDVAVVDGQTFEIVQIRAANNLGSTAFYIVDLRKVGLHTGAV